MRRSVPVYLFALALLLPLPAHAQSPDTTAADTTAADANVEAATQAAQEWLMLLDAGELEATWSEASEALQSQVTAEQWTAQIRQVQSQLDALQERALTNSRYTTSLPNAPEGEYVVLQYRTTYGTTNTTETLAMRKENDAWRVAGYFVRPEGQ